MPFTNGAWQIGFDFAIFADEERARVRDAGLPPSSAFVENAERFDGCALVVGKQRECDALLVGESLENVNGIVTDRNDLDSALTDGFKVLLQLHELPLAEGSPFGGTMEDQRSGLFFQQ